MEIKRYTTTKGKPETFMNIKMITTIINNYNSNNKKNSVKSNNSKINLNKCSVNPFNVS